MGSEAGSCTTYSYQPHPPPQKNHAFKPPSPLPWDILYVTGARNRAFSTRRNSHGSSGRGKPSRIHSLRDMTPRKKNMTRLSCDFLGSLVLRKQVGKLVTSGKGAFSIDIRNRKVGGEEKSDFFLLLSRTRKKTHLFLLTLFFFLG